jgi:hypothetical protein
MSDHDDEYDDPEKLGIHEIRKLLEIRDLVDELFDDAEFIPGEEGPKECFFSQEILEELWEAVYEPEELH